VGRRLLSLARGLLFQAFRAVSRITSALARASPGKYRPHFFHPWFAPFEEVGPFALNEITEAERNPPCIFKEGGGSRTPFVSA
jgi:hypothetical protein